MLDETLHIDEKECKRRKRKLTIKELIVGVYILYPRYVSPKSGKFFVKEIEELKNIYKLKDKINSNI